MSGRTSMLSLSVVQTTKSKPIAQDRWNSGGELFCSDSLKKSNHTQWKCTFASFGIPGRAHPVFGEFVMHEVFEADRKPTDAPASPIGRDELRYRLRQQSLLGEFGSTAMQTRDLQKILQRATELCASGCRLPS